MKIIRTKNYEEMSLEAAKVLAAQIVLKPNSVLGLATGSSPIGLYDKLVEWNENGLLDFSDIRSVNLDEYCGLDGTNDQSYRYFMDTNLFNRVNIDKANTNVPNGKAADYAAEGARYDELIASLGGIDIQLLGIGPDGHIGFNEPDTFFTKETHVVNLDPSTIEANARFFASADDVPRQAVTMGMGGIMGAKKVLLIASGASKKEILEKALFGPITPEVPASLLQLHPDLTVVCAVD
ncbi:MAG: glucosamine-6-phosphate deaminase [Clostridia bacterium]|nr:glucosamine-6-phosphate deaminase [Clostridia bacterium]